MATSLSTAEVLEANEENDWDNSESDGDYREEEDTIVTQDPLDFAQCSTVSANYLPSHERDSAKRKEVSNEKPDVDLQSESDSISSVSTIADEATSAPIGTSNSPSITTTATITSASIGTYSSPSITTTVPSVTAATITSPFTVTNIPFNPPGFPHHVGPVNALHSTATPLEYFMLLFDDDCFQLVADQTNLYASQNPPGIRYKWYDNCQ